jgi:serine/threonine protein phosphatase 1
MRTLAIGDIHGCISSLVTLLKQVQPGAEDQVIFLGDYIDSGPAACQVIELLLELKKSCSPVFLRGNHEVMILEAREDPLKSHLWQSYGGLETAFSYGANFREDWASAIPMAHWTFFEQTVKFFETERHIFVHACLAPQLDMDDQPDWLLYWGTFERLEPHKSGKRILCGHTPQHSGNIKDIGFATCIDTGSASGGWLTCLDVNSGQYWQANEEGKTRGGRMK